ncbi:MAG: energy transducer TonB [Bacteroidales bacterium]|nr:energy transducer TonB [Bacteroidales bacterium]
MAKKNVDLTSQEWRDLVFEGKNHDFGAYQLRKKSDRRHNLAALYTLIGLIVLIIGIFAWSKFSDYRAEQRAIALKEQQEKMMAAALAEQQEQEEQEEPQEEEQRFEEPEPEIKEVPEEVLNTIQQTQIDIVDKVVNEVKDVQEIKESDAFAGAVTQEGSGDADKAKAFQEAVVTAPVEEPKPVVEEKKEEKIFEAVEQPAEFPGGMGALMKWLSNNIRYPEAAAQNDIQGRVVLKFVVERDGSIGNVSVLKGVDKDLDREAIRVVKKMPKWQPGKNNGVAVRCYYQLPVTFRLAEQ